MQTIASTIEVGDMIELITVGASHPNALRKGARQQQYSQGPKSPVEFVTVKAVGNFRGNNRQRTFTFRGGGTLSVQANSKVTTP